MQRCPVCAAEGVVPPQCRRCKADLELVARAEESLRRQACAALLACDYLSALLLQQTLTHNDR